MTRVIVDPITRIEGHLRIEAVVENGVITDAFSAGTMVRGLEKILIGRDPRDAWAITERVCGVCTSSMPWPASAPSRTLSASLFRPPRS